MQSTSTMTYAHTQRAPLGWYLVMIAVAAFAVAWFTRGQWPAVLILSSIGAAMILLSLLISTLTVADEGESLAVRFGPLPLFRKRIAYGAIGRAEPARSAIIDGWGIHYIPSRGWTYNIWGRECVELTVNGRVMRIGTDDADNLARFIRTKIRD